MDQEAERRKTRITGELALKSLEFFNALALAYISDDPLKFFQAKRGLFELFAESPVADKLDGLLGPMVLTPPDREFLLTLFMVMETIRAHVKSREFDRVSQATIDYLNSLFPAEEAKVVEPTDAAKARQDILAIYNREPTKNEVGDLLAYFQTIKETIEKRVLDERHRPRTFNLARVIKGISLFSRDTTKLVARQNGNWLIASFSESEPSRGYTIQVSLLEDKIMVQSDDPEWGKDSVMTKHAVAALVEFILQYNETAQVR